MSCIVVDLDCICDVVSIIRNFEEFKDVDKNELCDSLHNFNRLVYAFIYSEKYEEIKGLIFKETNKNDFDKFSSLNYFIYQVDHALVQNKHKKIVDSLNRIKKEYIKFLYEKYIIIDERLMLTDLSTYAHQNEIPIQYESYFRYVK